MKRKNAAMLPTKQWITFQEACEFTDMWRGVFDRFAIDHQLTISAIGKKRYYKVSEIEKAIEKNIIHKKTA